MKIAVLNETSPGEARVALMPDSVQKLVSAKASLFVESGAGLGAARTDDDFKNAGAEIVTDRNSLLASADVLVTVARPSAEDFQKLRKGAVVLGFLHPLDEPAKLTPALEHGLTTFSMELVPRITRAQAMDALSSMATVAGYKAVLLGADRIPRMFPLLMTAAGTVPPARVLILGAGVAGLQAIATARRLGAVVEAYDVRGAARDQVKSLGARFVDTGVSAEGSGGYARELTAEERAKQQEVLDARIAAADAVISTAAVPGRPAPRIISRAVVERMRAGSVVIDIAAEQGGNCELTRAGEVIEHRGVRVVGPVNLPAELAYNASEMYARNLYNFLKPALVKGELAIDWSDEVFAQSCLTSGGQIKHEPTAKALEGTT